MDVLVNISLIVSCVWVFLFVFVFFFFFSLFVLAYAQIMVKGWWITKQLK